MQLEASDKISETTVYITIHEDPTLDSDFKFHLLKKGVQVIFKVINICQKAKPAVKETKPDKAINANEGPMCLSDSDDLEMNDCVVNKSTG